MAGSKSAAARFAAAWEGRGYEKGDTAPFWIDIATGVLGMGDVAEKVQFEQHAANGGFIDVLFPDTGVLVEQKALGVDLNKPEQRQGRMVTPFEQALDYAEGFSLADQPRFIVTCNFSTFRVYDRDAHNRAELPGSYLEFSLAELGEHPEYLAFVADPANSRAEKERAASVQAGALIGELYDALLANYDRTSADDLHMLNVLCVRLVFCLYAEDAGLFERDALYNYLKDVQPQDFGLKLEQLFCALDTPRDRRPRFETCTKPFPYVNGGLFHEQVAVPPFDAAAKELLLEKVSKQTDWSQISPTIFGGIFEGTLNPETRRQGGMHYTSPENIHKVIDPLFYDDLRSELEEICTGDATPRTRKARLKAFHEKIASLEFLDPACGSGNFLTETYTCLRRLEDRCLAELSALSGRMADGQMSMLLNDEGESAHVSLNQFHGIEVNDFACRVAKTALWIAKLQADARGMALDTSEPFPLREAAHVVCANALNTDWHDVLAGPGERTFIIGNPPFRGARFQTPEQKAEVAQAFHNAKNCGNVDYVGAWFVKAAEYMAATDARCAFVATNSICQGEQVANVWEPIVRGQGAHIDFAHDTFRWSNEAEGQAHVFVIVVGFSCRGGCAQRRLFHHAGPDVPAVETACANINAYLKDGPDAFVWSRKQPLSDVPRIGIGNKPIDGGNYLFKEDEMCAFVAAEPGSAAYFHPWVGSEEFLNGKRRWVLWLGDAAPEELVALPRCRERVLAVRDYRLASTSAPTRKLAQTPTRFHVENMPEGNSIIIPEVSSERRRYVPMGFVGPETLCSDLVFLIPNRYSGDVVYNNFVWPAPTDAQRARVEACAQVVLDARALHPASTLAQMYDPNNECLFPELAQAHRALDAAVEEAYDVDFAGDEAAMVAHLLALYAAATGR